MSSKCSIEMFDDIPGNFLALPESDLILYKKTVGRKRTVHCFTYAEAKNLLQQRVPSTPAVGKLPKNFIQDLKQHMSEIGSASGKNFAISEWTPSFRGLSEAIFSKNKYSNLGWEPGQDPKKYSKEFKNVQKALEELSLPPDWSHKLHTAYPGVEYDKKGGFLQLVDSVEEEAFIPGKLSKMFRRKYELAPTSVGMRPDLHNKNQLKWLLDDWKDKYEYMGNDMKTYTISNSDTVQKKQAQEQIKKLLSGTYKIHLQPEPEYQIPVLEKIFEQLSIDKELEKNIESLKAVVPYHRTVSDDRVPAIVIYPNYGKKAAQYVLTEIIKLFDDTKGVGLNITPRFNHRYNDLVYWASYDGSSKRDFKEQYGEDIFKTVFAEPDYAHFICDDNECHMSPEL